MSAHTPGPWEIGINLPEIVHVFAGKTPVAFVQKRKDPQRMLANGRLIAAAPDLLAACKNVLACCALEDIGEAAYAPLIAALAKAEGAS